MSVKVEWTCDLCGQTDETENVNMRPFDWKYITVDWGRAWRTGNACDDCTSLHVPPMGMMKYWANVIKFLKGIKNEPPKQS